MGADPNKPPGQDRPNDRLHGLGLDQATYNEIRAIAAALMASERPWHTLQGTALTHEALIRLADSRSLEAGDPNAWKVAAVGVMRRILIDHARARGRSKRGGEWSRAPAEAIDGVGAGQEISTELLLGIEEALGELEQFNRRHAQIVELRFFGGLTVVQTATVLGVSERTIRSEWQIARAWLQTRLSP